MPRKLRLEFPGAIYHLINRGNYRSPVFETAGARQAFEECLFEACARSSWLLHAFVVMTNHYHLAVETPLGNMVAGMQWLQSTFGNRFNRLRGEHGHLFQGRYKALVVEDGEYLGRLCDYIHLNPVRAGILPLARLPDYRHSSYWYLRHPRWRRDFFRVDTGLVESGNRSDTPAGWNRYAEHLARQLAAGPANAPGSMSKGWVLGGQEFKRTLLQDHDVAQDARAWESVGARQVKEEKWRQALEKLLFAVPRELRADQRAGAPWKVKLAAAMKSATDASNGWLAAQLDMSSARYLAKLVSCANKGNK